MSKKININKIFPYPKNAKKHPKKQVGQIANSIKEFGFNQPIVIDGDGIIIAGHGRYEAAKSLEMNEVPVIQVDLTKEQARAYRLADNKLNESDWEMERVIEELKELSKEMINLTGFSEDLLGDFGKYTQKVIIPVYKPRGDKPSIKELYNEESTKKLLEKIKEADLPEEEKEFLKLAAYRHCIFNYENIADYYAHSQGELRELMEEMALVIIDYDDAIEKGYVNVYQKLQNLMEEFSENS